MGIEGESASQAAILERRSHRRGRFSRSWRGYRPWRYEIRLNFGGLGDQGRGQGFEAGRVEIAAPGPHHDVDAGREEPLGLIGEG